MSGFADLPDQINNTIAPSTWAALVQQNERFLAGYPGPSGTNPEWSKPLARFTKTASQTGLSSGDALILDDIRAYTMGELTIVSSTQITIPTDRGGFYMIGASLRIDAHYSGTDGDSIAVKFLKNGTDTIGVENRALPNLTGAAAHFFTPSTLAFLLEGDYVEVIVEFNGLTTVGITTAAFYSPDVWLAWQGVGF